MEEVVKTVKKEVSTAESSKPVVKSEAGNQPLSSGAKPELCGKPIKKEPVADAKIVCAAAPASVPHCAAAPSEAAPPAAPPPVSQPDEQPAAPPPTDEDGAGDLAPGFVPLADTGEPSKTLTQKQLFMASDIVIPGIAIKKFKEAITETDADSTTWVGVMGEASTTMYKKTKRSVEAVFMGTPSNQAESFFKKLQEHLAGRKIAAVMLASNACMGAVEAALLAKCYV